MLRELEATLSCGAGLPLEKQAWVGIGMSLTLPPGIRSLSPALPHPPGDQPAKPEREGPSRGAKSGKFHHREQAPFVSGPEPRREGGGGRGQSDYRRLFQ